MLQLSLFGDHQEIPKSPIQILKERPEPHPKSPLVASYGAGRNSTAMLIVCAKMGIKVDLILFADTGGELSETYNFIEIFSEWLLANNMPAITVISRNPTPPSKSRKTYNVAKVNYFFLLKHNISCEILALCIWWICVTGHSYSNLEEYCLVTQGLPSVAFNIKACSKKWKIEPFEAYVDQWLPAQIAWAKGLPVRRMKGIHSKEINRLLDKNGFMIPLEEGGYSNEYPLVVWGIDNAMSSQIIESVGLPLPPKSACFFCPSRKLSEIRELDESMRARATLMEQVWMNGIHHDPSSSVKGLGRSFAWSSLDQIDDLSEAAIDFRQDQRSCNCIE